MHTRYGEGDQSDGPPPIVIDLGKATGDSLSQLRHGKGRLMDDVAAVIKQIQEEAGAALAGKELVPVVVTYKKKRKKRRPALWFRL